MGSQEVPNSDDDSQSLDGWSGVILGVVSSLAALYAGWLTKIKLESLYSCNSNAFNSCGGEGSPCHRVFSSPWSEIGGVPVTIFAVAFYIALLVLALMWTAKAEWLPGHFRPILFLAAIANMLVTIAMATYAAEVVGVFCRYCAYLYLASAAVLGVAVFGLATPRFDATLGTFGFSWLTKDALKVLAGLSVVFCGAVWVQIGIYEGTKVSSLEQHCVISRTVTLPRSRLVRGESTRPIRVAEFMDLSCSHCKAQSEMLDAAIERELPDIQLHLFAFPRDEDPRCCRICSSAEGPSTRAKSCQGALLLQCVALRRTSDDAKKLLSEIWKQQESLARHSGAHQDEALFTEGNLRALVQAALKLGGRESQEFVHACLADLEVQREVQDQVLAGEMALAGMPEAARHTTPFALLFAAQTGELRGLPDYLSGEKCLTTWQNRQQRLRGH
jgi:uncharacterized membrane protein